MMSDNNPLMSIAFAVDCCVYFSQGIADFLNSHHFNTDSVRHLIPEMTQGLFPDDLRTDNTFGLICHHIVRKILRSFRQVFHDAACQFIQTAFSACADRNNIIEPVFGEFRGCGKNRVRTDQIDLVQRENFRDFVFLQIFSEFQITVCDM